MAVSSFFTIADVEGVGEATESDMLRVWSSCPRVGTAADEVCELPNGFRRVVVPLTGESTPFRRGVPAGESEGLAFAPTRRSILGASVGADTFSFSLC